MADTPTYAEVAQRAGISPSYAHQIVSGDRTPKRSLAIHIMRSTGWRHDSIADLTDEQMTMLEAIEPWSPRPTPAVDQAA